MTRGQEYAEEIRKVQAEIDAALLLPEVPKDRLRHLYRRRRSLVAAVRYPLWKVNVYEWLPNGQRGRMLASLEVSAPIYRVAIHNALTRYERIYQTSDAVKLTATAERRTNKRKARPCPAYTTSSE